MIDRDALLRPISAVSIAGENLAFSELHDSITEARREDSAATSAGIWEAEQKRANWDLVIQLSVEGLTTRSKDLQLAIWLAEALLHKQGIAGLTEGLEIITELCKAYWDHLYPLIEDGDTEARLSPFAALESRVVPALMLVPLTTGGPGQEQHYNQQNLLNAQRIEPLAVSNPKAYKTAINSGDIPMSTITNAASRTSVEFFRQLTLDLRGGEAALQRLAGTLSEHCGYDAPGFTKLAGTLGQLQQTIGRLGAGRLMMDEPAIPVGAAATEEGQAMATTHASPAMPGRIASREDAYRYLTEAANYLLATEPHSPVPYLIKRAIHWGELPLGSLLTELIDDDERTRRLFKLLSIQS
jgi:type VI secretion system ImpA family protein